MASTSEVNIPEALFKCVLPPCKHRWVTALAVVETRVSLSGSIALVCGDRSGSVHYYCVLTDVSHHHTVSVPAGLILDSKLIHSYCFPAPSIIPGTSRQTWCLPHLHMWWSCLLSWSEWSVHAVWG